MSKPLPSEDDQDDKAGVLASGWRRVLAVVLVLASVGGGATASGAQRSSKAERWTAEPAWISNVGVYRGGEYVYQDYLYDDHGPNTDGLDRRDQAFGASPNPSQPTDARYSPTGGSIRHVGDFMYPAQDNHMINAADLVEWRVTADRSAVHYLARLGALTEADQAVLAVCVDTDRSLSTGQHTAPFGSNITTARLGCEQVYTVTGTQAFVTDAAGETTPLKDLGGATSADLDDNTIEFSVPRAVADPGRTTWRYTVASGLWDGDGWLAPAPRPIRSRRVCSTASMSRSTRWIPTRGSASSRASAARSTSSPRAAISRTRWPCRPTTSKISRAGSRSTSACTRSTATT